LKRKETKIPRAGKKRIDFSEREKRKAFVQPGGGPNDETVKDSSKRAHGLPSEGTQNFAGEKKGARPQVTTTPQKGDEERRLKSIKAEEEALTEKNPCHKKGGGGD